MTPPPPTTIEPMPCPFCGEILIKAQGMRYWVHPPYAGESCLLAAKTFHDDSIEQWNRRQPTPEAAGVVRICPDCETPLATCGCRPTPQPTREAVKHLLASIRLAIGMVSKVAADFDDEEGNSTHAALREIDHHLTGTIIGYEWDITHPPKPEPTEAVAWGVTYMGELMGACVYGDEESAKIDMNERNRKSPEHREERGVIPLYRYPVAPKPPAEWVREAVKSAADIFCNYTREEDCTPQRLERLMIGALSERMPFETPTAPAEGLTHEEAMQLADSIERKAFDMPAPNSYTPQFVMLANSIRSFCYKRAAAPKDKPC